MKLIFAIGLLFVMVFASGFAFASPYQSSKSSPGVSCPNPEIVTVTDYQRIFTGTHSGWITVPVKEKVLRCPAPSGSGIE